MNKNQRSRLLTEKQTYEMVLLAILVAIMLIFAFTPLGFLRVGAIEITFMTIPIAIGAILLGPKGGAILGTLFGAISFFQCFGLSPLGVILLSIDPVATFITCIIPRFLCGFIPGIVFNAMIKHDKTKTVSYYVTALLTALLNTIFFVGCIILFFWRSETFAGTMTEAGISMDSLWLFIVGFVGTNGVIEAAVNFIIGASIAKVVTKVAKK